MRPEVLPTRSHGLRADRLSRIWGQQVVIENKPGGGTNIAAAAVAGSDPYGHTMFIGSSSLATSRLLYRSLPYALGDLAPVTLVCTFPLLLLVPNSSPARSVAEFIEPKRKGQGDIRVASDIEMTHVPYRAMLPRSLIRSQDGSTCRSVEAR